LANAEQPPAGLYVETLPKGSIRLLRLQRNADVGELYFHLITVELQQAPDYGALSYVWGNPFLDLKTGEAEKVLVFDKQIFCNDAPFLVTANVYEMLDTIFQLSPAATVWIDCVSYSTTIKIPGLNSCRSVLTSLMLKSGQPKSYLWVKFIRMRNRPLFGSVALINYWTTSNGH
jgi:hypothetical protein